MQFFFCPKRFDILKNTMVGRSKPIGCILDRIPVTYLAPIAMQLQFAKSRMKVSVDKSIKI